MALAATSRRAQHPQRSQTPTRAGLQDGNQPAVRRQGRQPLAGGERRTGRLEIRGFKAYIDGSMGSRTAYMREPFSDEKSTAPVFSSSIPMIPVSKTS